MTKCTPDRSFFAKCKRRRVDACFNGGAITSDAGGALLLRQAEKQLGLLRELSRLCDDERRKKSVRHSLESLLRQRVFGVALGYEDLNDHTTLRDDPALQTSAEQVRRLASPSTLGRLEHRAGVDFAWLAHEVLLMKFIDSFTAPPEELVLAFYVTDDPVHGKQEGRFFHGYYDGYCFLPLYVFCGSQLLVAYLRPSNIDGAKHAWAVLSLLVKRLREVWPTTRFMLRGGLRLPLAPHS